LKAGDGFAKIEEFLPEEVADGVRLVLENLPAKEWERAGDDSGYDDRVQHGFSIIDVERHEVLLGVARLLAGMLPGTLPNFSGARYNSSDHIAPHDDLVPESYTEAELSRTFSAYGICGKGQNATPRLGLQAASKAWREDNCSARVVDDCVHVSLEKALEAGDLEAVRRAVEAGGRASLATSQDRSIPCTRQVAVAYYLTRDWKPDYGGQFVDLDKKSHHVPEFNTLVAFEVPRMHEVTPVSAPPGIVRHSIFGWWLMQNRDVRALKKTRKRSSAASHVKAAKRPATASRT
jgi:hypothetical protein